MSLDDFPRLRLVVSAAAVAAALTGSIGLVAQAPPVQPGGRVGGVLVAGPAGPGGPGGPGGQEMRIVAQFDTDRDERLNAAERKAARAWLESQNSGRGRGGPAFFGRGSVAPAEPGARVTPADVRTFPNAPVYDMSTLRTFFFDFENADWEAELAAFYNTDVEVPAALTVDGRVFRDVGVRFRGNSSYFIVPPGRKRSLNVSLDFVHDNQQLGGYRSEEHTSELQSLAYLVCRLLL